MISTALTQAQTLIGSGVISADPTLHIAAAWIFSALALGGLSVYAIIAARKLPRA